MNLPEAVRKEIEERLPVACWRRAKDIALLAYRAGLAERDELLREALDGWQSSANYIGDGQTTTDLERIAEIRAKLGEKP